MTAPTLAEIESGVRALLIEHGLTDWHFAWDNASRRAGACRFTTRTISFSRAIFGLTDEARAAWRDTALHEIAHALVGPRVKAHGYEWYATARRIGCSGRRTHELTTPPRAIVGTCSAGCSATRDRARFPKPGTVYVCRKCRVRITWARRADDAAARYEVRIAAQTAEVTDEVVAARSAAARKAWATRRAAQAAR